MFRYNCHVQYICCHKSLTKPDRDYALLFFVTTSRKSMRIFNPNGKLGMNNMPRDVSKSPFMTILNYRDVGVTINSLQAKV